MRARQTDRPSSIINPVWGFICAIVVLAGCSGNDTICTESADCFRGEVCAQGECVESGNVSTNGATNASTNGATNASTNGSTNGAPNNEQFCGFDNCEVDPFLCACADDGNDSFAEPIDERTIGCQNNGFVPLSKTIRARFCALEPVDLYRQLFVECDTNTFRLEVILDPVVEVCDTSLMKMNLSVQGKSCQNQADSSDITCSWNNEGQFVAQALVRPGGSVSSFSVSIDTGEREDIDFVYDLTVTVSE